MQLRPLQKLTSVEYSSLPGATLRRRVRRLDPSWHVALTTCLTMTMIVGAFAILSLPLGAFLTLPYLLAASLVLLYFGASDTIEVGETGVVFALSESLPLRFRNVRLWSDVENVEIVSGGGDQSAQVSFGGSAIKIAFRSGGHVTLDLKGFTREGLSTFAGALEQWSGGAKNRRQIEHLPALFEHENAAAAAAAGPAISYTKFWEEELADNYSFTSFVPLQPQHHLQDGTYRVVRQIAAGGFSAIYLIERPRDSEKFILKESVIPPTADEQFVNKVKEHFRREADFLIRLDHPSVARVYDHFVEGGRDYLLLQYIEGPDARTLVRQDGRQPQERVIRWTLGVARVLDYLHNQAPPVVHRDVSPDNLVLSADNNLVLIDFGAANEFVGQATGTLVGKQAFMAPEQIRGKACPASDIYSLGATAYFLLTGRDPEPLAVLHPGAARADVSAELDELVAACTKLDASERISTAGELIEHLEALYCPSPVDQTGDGEERGVPLISIADVGGAAHG